MNRSVFSCAEIAPREAMVVQNFCCWSKLKAKNATSAAISTMSVILRLGLLLTCSALDAGGYDEIIDSSLGIETRQAIQAFLSEPGNSSAAQGSGHNAERWLDEIEARSALIQKLSREQQVLNLHVQLARLRRECQNLGIHCDAARPGAAGGTAAQFIPPQLLGVSGTRVLLSEDGSSVWYRQGDKYRGYQISKVGLDEVKFQSSSDPAVTYRIKINKVHRLSNEHKPNN